MADSWPTLSRNFDLSSQYGGPLRLVTLSLGDGYEQRVEDGINNQLGDMKITYQALEQSDWDTLYAFILAHKGGETVDVPNYVVDISGATIGQFYILDFTVDHRTSPLLYDVEVLLREVI